MDTIRQDLNSSPEFLRGERIGFESYLEAMQRARTDDALEELGYDDWPPSATYLFELGFHRGRAVGRRLRRNLRDLRLELELAAL